MTDEQINWAIVEATNADPHWKCAKDYCNDLNAMHEAEHLLTYVQLCNYIDLLIEFSPEAAVATARQRAEAFLRTLGKWEEVQG
jgi:hypothetical protein